MEQNSKQMTCRVIKLFLPFLFFLLCFFSCVSASITDSTKKEIDIVLEIANIYHTSGDFESEKAVLEKFISQRGIVSDKINYNLCLLYFNDANYEKTIENCDKFFRANRAFLDYLRLKAESYKALSNPQKAIECYQELVSTISATADDYLQYATLLNENEQKDKAIEVLQNAIDKNYVMSKALLDLASTLVPENDEYRILLDGIKDASKEQK